MLWYANTSVFMWKSIVFWFCTVWCLHTRCEMRHFYTLRCPAPCWLIQCKPYQNRFIIAKVIDKSLGARFLWPTVYFGYEEKYRKWMERLGISVTQWGEVEEGNWRGWSWWVRRWSTGQRAGWVQLLTLWMFVRLLYHLFDFLCRQLERPFDITYDTIGQKSLTWTYTLQQHSCTSYVHVFGSNKGTFFGFINIASIIAFVYFQVAGKNQLSFVGNQWIHPYSTGFYGYIVAAAQLQTGCPRPWFPGNLQ